MANNRELSQLGSFIVVDDSTKNIGIATTATPYVGIGTTNPQAKLHVVGDAIISGNVSVGGTVSYDDVTNIDSVGVITARSDVRVGGNLSVVGVTTLASAGGITTTGGDLYVGNELYVKGGLKITNTGIVTSTNPGVTTVVYYGDGSNLFGVSAFAVINQDLSSSYVYPTLANNAGVSTVGIATTGTSSFVFQPSTGNVGLGSTQPAYKIDAVGDINITGDYKVNGRSVLDDALIYSIVFG
jgi:hypothetical protein